MIPAKFDYVRPSSLGDAVSALASGGEDAKVIAGGQSLRARYESVSWDSTWDSSQFSCTGPWVLPRNAS